MPPISLLNLNVYFGLAAAWYGLFWLTPFTSEVLAGEAMGDDPVINGAVFLLVMVLACLSYEWLIRRSRGWVVMGAILSPVVWVDIYLLALSVIYPTLEGKPPEIEMEGLFMLAWLFPYALAIGAWPVVLPMTPVTAWVVCRLNPPTQEKTAGEPPADETENKMESEA